ncbi:MAG: tetratricopeptide repeat protein, partial [Verrucomicrobiales bacterium]|nr:tetratricopeptide repeat protein [Verrucomicrobiales bacterium]
MAHNHPHASHHPHHSSAEIAPEPGLESWMEKNFKKVLIGSLLLIIVVCLAGVIYLRTQASNHAAAEAFTQATSVADLDAVISEHSGAPGAALAEIEKARQLWEENKKDASIDALRAFTEQQSDHPLLASALVALGSRLDAIGESSKAEAAFTRVVNDFPESAVAPLAELRLADLLWKEGKVDDAKAIYESLPSKYPGTNQPFFDQSQSRLQWLSAGLPDKEVDGPPAPPPAPGLGGTPPTLTPGAIPLAPPQIQLGSGTPAATVTPSGAAVTAPISIKPMAKPDAEIPPVKINTPATGTPANAPKPAPKADTPPAPAPKPQAPAAKADAPAPKPAAPAKADAPKPTAPKADAPPAPATKPQATAPTTTPPPAPAVKAPATPKAPAAP